MAALPMTELELEKYKKKYPELGLFRGKHLVFKRSKDWKLIDETNKYSGKQRKECQTITGKECTLYPFPIGMKVLEMFKQ